MGSDSILKFFDVKKLVKKSKSFCVTTEQRHDAKPCETEAGKYASYADKEPVQDKYKLVYAFFFLQGVGVLLPWNMFINSGDYFTKYKFVDDPILANKYLPLVGVLSQVTNLLFIIINMLVPIKGKLLARAVLSLSIMIVVFFITCIFPNVDTSSWMNGFFILTMASVVAINAAVGMFQSTVYGDAGKFPQLYSNCVVTGGNFSGIFGSVLFLICLATTTSYSLVATVYFAIAFCTIIICLACFLCIRKNRYYTAMSLSDTPDASSVQRIGILENISGLWQVLKEIPVKLYCVFCVFFVSLTIFPSMHANVSAIDPDFGIPPKYFTAITCFLFFNIFAFLGNIASAFFVFPSKRWLWIPITMRALLIPVFFYSNFLPSLRTYPVYIYNDYVPIFAEILMAFTSGYYSSLAIMVACKSVPPEKSTRAGMLTSFFIVLGVAIGVNFSMVMVDGVASWGPCIQAAKANGTMLCP